jgi:A/G-specific adenine glycosylase
LEAASGKLSFAKTTTNSLFAEPMPSQSSGTAMSSLAPRTTHRATPKLVPLLLNWFAANARDMPWRRTRDPYAIWVSEIMLQQTQVKTVIPYWERWMRELPTIEALANARADKIHKLWEGLGYYTRVRNLQRAAQQILAQHAGKFPENFDDILALPGIGRYTAGAISSIAFDQPRPIVDGNVIRVLTRVFGIATNPREKKTNALLWQLAEKLVTEAARLNSSRSSRRESAGTSIGLCSALNQSLMELGAVVCAPRSPQCGVCSINKFCIARKNNLQEQLPNLAKREAATARHFIAFVVERDGKYLVRQRPASVVNAHLWEFPNIETATDRQKTAAPFQIVSAKPLCTIKHSITRYRITLEVWHAQLEGASSKISGRWLSLAQLRKLAFTSAHKKVLARL